MSPPAELTSRCQGMHSPAAHPPHHRIAPDKPAERRSCARMKQYVRIATYPKDDAEFTDDGLCQSPCPGLARVGEDARARLEVGVIPHGRLRNSAAGDPSSSLSRKPLVARDALRARLPSGHGSTELDPIARRRVRSTGQVPRPRT
jgi:hypothetical protein